MLYLIIEGCGGLTRRVIPPFTEEQKELIRELRAENVEWKDIALEIGLEKDRGRMLAQKVRRQGWLNSVSVANRVMDKVAEGKLYTQDELLIEHGFDPTQFRIKNATSNNWGIRNDEELMNYQHKVVALPIEQLPTYQDVVDVIERIEPLEVELLADEIPQQYLLIPLYDMHFGVNTYDRLLLEISDIVRNTYEEILIVVGGDYLHVDNLNNTTVKGTQLEEVDFPKMISDGVEFLKSVIKVCLENSPNVKLVYLPGNHASSNDYIITWGAASSFDGLDYDVDLEQFKHAWLGNHSIFLHHGDKVKNEKKLLEIMVSKYAREWGESKSRYLITGHLHHERSLAFGGLTHYQMMSPSASSKYERDNGFVGSECGLMLIEFNNLKRSAIYYLQAAPDY